jgi:hypothetical protein
VALLGHALRHSRAGDAVWLVGDWAGEGYQLTLWSRDGGMGRPAAAEPGGLDLRRAAATLRRHGGELELQDCGPDGLRLHVHLPPAPVLP